MSQYLEEKWMSWQGWPKAGDVVELPDGLTLVVTLAKAGKVIVTGKSIYKSIEDHNINDCTYEWPPPDWPCERVWRNGRVVWSAERAPVRAHRTRDLTGQQCMDCGAWVGTPEWVVDPCPGPPLTEKFVEMQKPPEPARTDTFPPDRFGKAARYLLGVLQGRKNERWTIEDAVEAARQAGLGTVNMEAAIEKLLAEGIIVRTTHGHGAETIMLTQTGSAYYTAWRFVNPKVR